MTDKTTKRVLTQLALANVVPLIGVAVLGWSLLDVLLIYLWETAVIGVLAAIRIYRTHAPSGSVGAALMSIGALAVVSIYVTGLYIGLHIMARDSGMFYRVDAPDLTVKDVVLSVPFIIAALIAAGANIYGYVREMEESTTRNIPALARPVGRTAALMLSLCLGYVLMRFVPSPAAVLLVLIVAKMAGEWAALTLYRPRSTS